MREKEIEIYFDWAVQSIGGRTWKFTSPGRKGVADRIACLPDGQTWFVEVKTNQAVLFLIKSNVITLCADHLNSPAVIDQG